MLRQAKINMMVIIGMMVAMGTVAFTAPEKTLDDVVWFEVESSSGDIESLATPPSTLNANNCLQSSITPDPCAVGFLQSEMDTSPNFPLSNISEIATSGLQVSYRQKDD